MDRRIRKEQIDFIQKVKSNIDTQVLNAVPTENVVAEDAAVQEQEQEKTRTEHDGRVESTADVLRQVESELGSLVIERPEKEVEVKMNEALATEKSVRGVEGNIVDVDELIKRIERIESTIDKSIFMFGIKRDGARKRRVKDQIISLLKQHKKLTSSQLGKLIGLSRTRCNEYFRELADERLVEGVIINRKKYYRLVKKR